MKNISILLIGILLVSFVFAQPQRGGQHLRKPHMERKMPFQKGGFGKPEHRERMEKMMVFKLTEDLELTTEQSEKFFPMLREHNEKMDKIDDEILKITKDINNKIKDGKKISDKEIDRTFEKVHSFEKKKIDEKARYLSELKSVLDNNQRVKFVTFKNRFARGVEERLRMKREELGRERERLERKKENLDEYRQKLNELEEN